MKRILVTGFAVLMVALFAVSPFCAAEKGGFESEAELEYVKDGNDKEMGLTFALTYGASEKCDIVLEIPYLWLDPEEEANVDGVGDIEIGPEYCLFEGSDSLPAASLGLTIKTATGDEDKGLGSGEIDYGLKTIFSKEIIGAAFDLELGYTLVGGEGEDDVFSYELASEYPLNDSFSLAGEISGETAFEGGFDDNPCDGKLGLNYALSKATALSAGFGFPFSDAGPDYSVTAGATVGF